MCNKPDNHKTEKKPSKSSDIVSFPQSRTLPKKSKGGYKDLGLSELTQAGGHSQPSLKGHWCNRCKGIWFGFAGECECPQCGNRNG